MGTQILDPRLLTELEEHLDSDSIDTLLARVDSNGSVSAFRASCRSARSLVDGHVRILHCRIRPSDGENYDILRTTFYESRKTCSAMRFRLEEGSDVRKMPRILSRLPVEARSRITKLSVHAEGDIPSDDLGLAVSTSVLLLPSLQCLELMGAITSDAVSMDVLWGTLKSSTGLVDLRIRTSEMTLVGALSDRLLRLTLDFDEDLNAGELDYQRGIMAMQRLQELTVNRGRQSRLLDQLLGILPSTVTTVNLVDYWGDPSFVVKLRLNNRAVVDIVMNCGVSVDQLADIACDTLLPSSSVGPRTEPHPIPAPQRVMVERVSVYGGSVPRLEGLRSLLMRCKSVDVRSARVSSRASPCAAEEALTSLQDASGDLAVRQVHLEMWYRRSMTVRLPSPEGAQRPRRAAMAAAGGSGSGAVADGGGAPGEADGGGAPGEAATGGSVSSAAVANGSGFGAAAADGGGFGAAASSGGGFGAAAARDDGPGAAAAGGGIAFSAAMAGVSAYGAVAAAGASSAAEAGGNEANTAGVTASAAAAGGGGVGGGAESSNGPELSLSGLALQRLVTGLVGAASGGGGVGDGASGAAGSSGQANDASGAGGSQTCATTCIPLLLLRGPLISTLCGGEDRALYKWLQGLTGTAPTGAMSSRPGQLPPSAPDAAERQSSRRPVAYFLAVPARNSEPAAVLLQFLTLEDLTAMASEACKKAGANGGDTAAAPGDGAAAGVSAPAALEVLSAVLQVPARSGAGGIYDVRDAYVHAMAEVAQSVMDGEGPTVGWDARRRLRWLLQEWAAVRELPGLLRLEAPSALHPPELRHDHLSSSDDGARQCCCKMGPPSWKPMEAGATGVMVGVFPFRCQVCTGVESW